MRPAAWLKTAGTCRELLAGEAHLGTFVPVAGIEPTNNGAERALRHGVISRKTSGGTASEQGSRFVERTLTVVATRRQQELSVLDSLTRCYQSPSGRPTSPVTSPLHFGHSGCLTGYGAPTAGEMPHTARQERLP